MDIEHYLKLADQLNDIQRQLIARTDRQAPEALRGETLDMISLASKLSTGLLLASTDVQRDLPDGFADRVDTAAQKLKAANAFIVRRDHDLRDAIARTHKALGETVTILEVVGRWPPDGPPPGEDEPDRPSKPGKP